MQLFEMAHRWLPTELVERELCAYPQFREVVANLPRRELGTAFMANWHFEWWGETPSITRDFVHSILVHASQQPPFLQALAQSQSGPHLPPEDVINPSRILFSEYVPWTIPSLADVEALTSVIRANHRDIYSERQVHSISAAALAIEFFTSLSTDKLQQIRDLRLLEDRLAVAFPECHARGLIPFALENPQLLIERSVNLWRNAFQNPDTVCIAACQNDGPDRYFDSRQLGVSEISRLVGPWIQEAEALPGLGMPLKAFYLVLDGSSLPEYTSIVFHNTLLRDAAWQSTLEECCRRESAPFSLHATARFYELYMYNGFPDSVAKLSDGTSIVRCNFELDAPWDVEEVLQGKERWSIDQWLDAWLQDLHESDRSFQPRPPLPRTWRELLRENRIPEEEVILHPSGFPEYPFGFQGDPITM
jgi:hypothetical protein